jgi:hypothetical protein
MQFKKWVRLGFAGAIVAVASSALACPLGGLANGYSSYARFPANRVCLPGTPSSSAAVVYSAWGEVYNNSTSATAQVICGLPNATGRSVSSIVAILKKVGGGSDVGPTNDCTLHAYTSNFSVVYSASSGPTSCELGLQLNNLGGASLDSNLRCTLSQRVGSAVASIADIIEVEYP